MTATRTLMAAASVVALLATAACARPAPPPAPPSEAPVAAEPAATDAHGEPGVSSAAPLSTEPASAPTGGGSGGCITTYVGGGYQPGLNGSPGIYSPGQPMTVCSPPPAARAEIPAAAEPARAAPAAAPADAN